jgi:hypothetical protein
VTEDKGLELIEIGEGLTVDDIKVRRTGMLPKLD